MKEPFIEVWFDCFSRKAKSFSMEKWGRKGPHLDNFEKYSLVGLLIDWNYKYITI